MKRKPLDTNHKDDNIIVTNDDEDKGTLNRDADEDGRAMKASKFNMMN